jgi:2-polyprenyl-6-methoxyphenol hydroxylase-like FAD-dependent oxidoreductase
VPPDWLTRATTLGPLASFDASERWVEHPCRDGVVLIGGAAAVSDPCFGCGLGLIFRDVWVLRDRLRADPDWNAAAHAYAEAHDRYCSAMRTINGWMRELFHERGPEADARRARALPLLAAEPDRAPDVVGRGPDSPSDEATRRRFLGEDERPVGHDPVTLRGRSAG